jgi:mTERF
MLVKFPRLVTLSLRNIKYTVGYLRFALNLPASNVQKILYRAPGLLGLDVDRNVQNKMDFLRQRLDLTDAELATVVTAMPTLLFLNVETNLRPKLDYLTDVLAAASSCKSSQQSEATTLSALRDMVLRLPILLGYSLALRIRPRVEAMIQAGLLLDLDHVSYRGCITIGMPMKQDAFDVWLQRRADKRSKLKELSGSGKSSTSDSMAPDATGANQPVLPILPYDSTASLQPRIVHWSRERQPPPE